MSLHLVTAPVLEPVTVQQLATHLRLNATDDPSLPLLASIVRQRCETATQRALITQTWDVMLDTWPSWTPEGVATLVPAGGWVDLPKPPLQAVTYVQYLDSAGTLQTWDPVNYVVDLPTGEHARRGRLGLAWAKVWPIIRYQMNSITIRIVAGYGLTPATVPGILRHAMLMDAGTLYEIRGAVLAGSRAAAIEIPNTTQDIYRSFKSW